MRFSSVLLGLFFGLLVFIGCAQSPITQVEAAAKEGNTEAQFMLGQAYGHGNGVDHDAVKAEHWYRLAAENGHPQAQLMLALAYTYGNGLPVDYVQAYKWLHLASNTLSIEDLETQHLTRVHLQKELTEKLTTELTKEEQKQSEALAKTWKQKHPNVPMARKK